MALASTGNTAPVDPSRRPSDRRCTSRSSRASKASGSSSKPRRRGIRSSTSSAPFPHAVASTAPLPDSIATVAEPADVVTVHQAAPSFQSLIPIAARVRLRSIGVGGSKLGTGERYPCGMCDHRAMRLLATFALALTVAALGAMPVAAQEPIDCGVYRGVACQGFFTDEPGVATDRQRQQITTERPGFEPRCVGDGVAL